jgi:hypothetical protein
MEASRALAERSESFMGTPQFVFRHGVRSLEAIHRGERDLSLLGVLTGGFSERFGGLLDVEQIIDDLKARPTCSP